MASLLAASAPSAALRRVAGALPRGRTLSAESWALRHRWMLGLLCANAAGLIAFGLAQGYGLGHSLFEGGVVATFAVAGAAARGDRKIGSVAVALGLLTASAVTVHLSGGAIEAHFHFFVMIAVLTLYEDWLPFLVAAGFVLLHHGIGGLVAPESVFAHAAGVAHPWRWASIHAGFVAAAGAANVLSWRLHEETRRHMRQLAQIVESSHDAIFSTDRDGTVLSWNGGAGQIFGRGAAEMLGGSFLRLLPPDELDAGRELLRRVLDGERLEQHDAEWCGGDGGRIAVRVSASPMRDVRGAVVGVSAIAQDVTEQRRSLVALERERGRLAGAEEIGRMGNWEWDCAADAIEWSDQLYRLFGVSREDFRATRSAYVELVHPEDRPALDEHLERAFALRRYDPIEHRIVRPDGEVRHIMLRGRVVEDDDGTLVRIVGVALDITERKLAEDAIKASREALSHQAHHDALTGLPNRTLLRDRADRALQRGRRDGSRTCLLFLDVDRFKVVNDSLGHAAGDQLLVQIAARLDEALRPADTVARFGGDEFAVLCEDMAEEQDGVAIAERALAALAQPFGVAGRELAVTVSIGVALSTPASSAESLLRDGDVAMYRAKELGGARHEIFDAAMNRRSLESLQVEAELRRGLSREELRLHYQPIVRLDDRAVVGAEALVRWEHPERGLLAPAEFIPIAEESSLIVALGDWVLRTACRQVAHWQHSLPEEFALSVNVSALQMAQPDFVATVQAALRDAGAEPGRLTLELTESALMQGNGRQTLLALEEVGVGVVLDDFGTGYSSLSHLSRFPLVGLKVDRSFLARMQPGSPEHAIIAAVATMAGAMRLHVVAEGIESDEQCETLSGLGYRLGQGYLFARPMPADAFARVLASAAAARG